MFALCSFSPIYQNGYIFRLNPRYVSDHIHIVSGWNRHLWPSMFMNIGMVRCEWSFQGTCAGPGWGGEGPNTSWTFTIFSRRWRYFLSFCFADLHILHPDKYKTSTNVHSCSFYIIDSTDHHQYTQWTSLIDDCGPYFIHVILIAIKRWEKMTQPSIPMINQQGSPFNSPIPWNR